MRVCELCGVDISHKRRDAKYCCDDHQRKGWRRRYYERNRDRELAKRREYRERTEVKAAEREYNRRPEVRAMRRDWKRANQDKVAQYKLNEGRKTRAEVLERRRIVSLKKAAAAVGRVFRRRIREQWREYKATDPAYLEVKKAENRKRQREYHRKIMAADPERMRNKNRQKRWKRRAARKAGAVIGPFRSRDEILAMQGGKCASCQRRGKGVDWHLDHIMPIDLGGAHTNDNLQVLCAACNQAKGAKHPGEWELQNGRLPLSYGETSTMANLRKKTEWFDRKPDGTVRIVVCDSFTEFLDLFDKVKERGYAVQDCKVLDSGKVGAFFKHKDHSMFQSVA